MSKATRAARMSWAKGAAELVVLDLADEGGAAAEAGDADDGVGRRAAGAFHRRPHGLIDLLGARLVDQRHGALVHAVRDQEIVLGAGDHVDDGVADAEHVVAGAAMRYLVNTRRTIAATDALATLAETADAR